MRLIHAYTIQRANSIDGVSGLLDWLLTPYYIKKAYPNSTLVLYTNRQSVHLLGNLWPHIKDSYDEVHVDLQRENKEIFSDPKFEAMSKELWGHGADFIVLDNDLYVFPGFLESIKSNYCVYYAEQELIPWYHSIINNEQSLLNAPEWFTWKSTPYNCATIRINDKELLLEYIRLYNTIQAEKLSDTRNLKAMVKEQWSLGELLAKHEIEPQCLFDKHYSFHKGCVKTYMVPSEVIQIQELLLLKLFPKIFTLYYNRFNHDEYFKTDFNIETCFKKIDLEYKTRLLAPILK